MTIASLTCVDELLHIIQATSNHQLTYFRLSLLENTKVKNSNFSAYHKSGANLEIGHKGRHIFPQSCTLTHLLAIYLS